MAQLRHDGPELRDGLVEQPVEFDGAVVEVALREPEGHPERHEPLLGSVVEVALEPVALVVWRRARVRAAVIAAAWDRRRARWRRQPEHTAAPIP